METDLDLGGMAFWLGLAAVIVATIIAGAMRDRSLHRLIEASIEKTGTVDPRLADLLEKEIARKAANDAKMWGAPGSRAAGGVWVMLRKVVSITIAVIGAIWGFFGFLLVMGRAFGPGPGIAPTEGGPSPILIVLIAVGVGAVVAGLPGLIAWLIWPKKKKPAAGEPQV